MSEAFDKWFDTHIDDFIDARCARFDCKLAWNAAMFHAADMAEDEADGFTRLYYAEYQCLMELSEKLRQEVHGE